MAQRTSEQGREVKGFYQLASIDAAAVGSPGPGEAISIQAELGDLRVRFDGTDPDSTTGQLIVQNSTCYFAGNLLLVRIIGVTGASIANIHTYGGPVNQG